MVEKITDDKLSSYLQKVGKPELIAWLMARCREDEKLRASLLDLAAPKEEAKSLASEINARTSRAWRLCDQRDGWKMALPISRELDQVLTSIQSLMDKGCLVEAEKLLVSFVKKAERGMAEVDDSYGHLWPTCQEGVTLWGEVWSRIEPRDTVQLVNLVYGHIHDNDYAVKDDMICKFAKALGDEGLHALQRRLRGDLAQLPPLDPEEPHWKRDFNRRQIISWLKDIADSLKDVDEYIAISESEQQIETDAMEISRRLFDAERFQEALTFLEKCRAGQGFLRGEPYDYPSLRCKILIALGRTEEAGDTLWQEFTKGLGLHTFEKVLELTPVEEKDAIHRRAVSLAEHYRSPEQGAYFLVQMNELERAARLIEQRQDEISGSWYSSLSKVAEALAGPYPSQAWLVYRSLLLDILNSARYKAYSHGAKYLALMEQLAEKANLRPRQAEFIQTLRQKHGRKSSFWAKAKLGVQ
ncbi:MAG: hypothetical protein JW720_14320 [Sedimentisphaerales bacterium]|nr:hypothetical protein [Sedimentisphaerales bacterium]